MANINICFGLLIFGYVLTMGVVEADNDDVDLLQHMEHLTVRRNPFLQQGNQVMDKRPEARKYIEEQFREYGLDVKPQNFNSSGNTVVEGVNVIGISKASENGKVLLVGADYDTSENGDPLKNNGAGVAAMLEAARLYMEDDDYQREGTVIFVAFDVSSKEYENFKGMPGSEYFVKNWLWPYLEKDASKFEGAIILDSITNANNKENTQNINGDFNKVFPEAYEQILADGSKGNFLGIVSQADQASQDLISKFSGNYNKDRKGRQFRVQEMKLAPTPPLKFVEEFLGHQSHFHFWTLQDDAGAHPLPALLLTDTEQYRRSPNGSVACTPTCKAVNFLTKERSAFMTKTTKALLGTLFDLRAQRKSDEDKDDNGNSGSFNTPSFVQILVLPLIIKLLRW